MQKMWEWLAEGMDLAVAPSFAAPGYHARSKTWDEDSIPASLEGKRYVVTGANSGIGKAATRQLAERGAEIVMVCRSPDRAEEARDELIASTGNENLELDITDLSSLEQAAGLAERLENGPSVDALVHNAGALLDERKITDEGYEVTFAVHVASPFLINRRLSDQLESWQSRVVWVSSGGMYTQRLQLESLARGHKNFDGVVAYAQCKRAQVILTDEFASRYGMHINSMHPGWVDTPGVRSSLPTFYDVTRKMLRSPDEGADTIVWLAASPQAADVSGEFFLDREPRRKHIPLKNTQSSRAEIDALWELCEETVSPYLADASR